MCLNCNLKMQLLEKSLLQMELENEARVGSRLNVEVLPGHNGLTGGRFFTVTYSLLGEVRRSS
jgi:hypothetical protein